MRLVEAQAEQIRQLQRDQKLQAENIQRLDAALAQKSPGVSDTAPGQQASATIAPGASPPTQGPATPPAKAEKTKAPATKLPGWLSRTTFSGTSYFRYSREFEPGAKDANA
ncbi:MAG: hypothetical protein HY237_14195, partial [Acidobacteria bacterium]|nr:hypothetical protein [Acidobacteriota bacterium]